MHNRREFLQHFALLGAAAALPIHCFSAENSMLPKPVGDGLFAMYYGQDIHKKKPPRKITIPDVGEFKVLKGDFHVHTLFSDGHVMPKDRVDEAVDNGLDVIALTDHIEYRPFLGNGPLAFAENTNDHNRAYNLAKPEADQNNLILVRGAEITKPVMPPGHFNALFVEDINPIAAVVDDWRKMLAVATDQGGFVHWNHPGWVAPRSGGLAEGVPMSFTDAHEEAFAKGHLHGVEVFNGVAGASLYPVALDWCNERDLVPFANSDIHQSEWNSYGHQNPLRPMTLVFAKHRSHDAVREAFFAKRTVGWAANMILGRPEWVEKLFRSCVEIEKTGSALALRNFSDIPCLFSTNGKVQELSAQGSLELAPSNQLTVINWFVGMNKPLEIAVR